MKNQSFFTLSPEKVLNHVEGALQANFPGARTTGAASALNSLENRVFEMGLEEPVSGELSVVAKFYRPGRWSREQILEEHAFISELQQSEVPAVGAITELQCTDDGIFFIVFPKVRGRLKDELSAEELRQIGRLLARMHSVGERFDGSSREPLNLESFGRRPLQELLESQFLEPSIAPHYRKVCEEIFAKSESPLDRAIHFSVHGDCHVGNILWNESGPFFLDFDDMTSAPPVQDLWMIVKGRDEADVQMRQEILSGYDLMREFDNTTLKLIEPLRALRLIHYSAWIAKRWEDPSFPKMFPSFGSQKYWWEEIEALHEISSLIF